MAILELNDVVVSYHAIEAVRGITMKVEQGEIVTLIGSNGAGKTTTLKTISGLLRSTSGEIILEVPAAAQADGSVEASEGPSVDRMADEGGGEGAAPPTPDRIRIDRIAPHDIVRLGISHAPEGRHIFPRMSVKENLSMGAYARRDQDNLEDDYLRVFDLFPVLKDRLNQAGGTLSGGEQQMLSIGRALMARPKILLLDEPSMGLAPKFVERIFEIIRAINAQGTTILLIEQNAQMALQTANRGYVIESGQIVLEDDARALLGNDRVRKAYLGED